MTLAASTNRAPDDDTALNASALFQRASQALSQNDLSAAATAFLKGEIRAEADFHCFPPAKNDDDGINKVRDQASELSEDINGQLPKDPRLYAEVVGNADSWVPKIAPGYEPGWAVKSRCTDYSKPAADSREFTLHSLRDQSRLLQNPDYSRAYNAFNEVYQDYKAPPPDDAYSPARVQAADAGRQDIIKIEKSAGITGIGAMLAYMGDMRPLAFHVLKSGGSQVPVQFPADATGFPSDGSSESARMVTDEQDFVKIWKALLIDPKEPLPVVDFNRQMVVVASAGQRLATAPMFINRVDYDSRGPILSVAMRVPVATGTCPELARDYPYVVAVMDKPAKLPITASFDRQNFPYHGC